MAASKLIALVFGLLLVFYLAGIFGPGPVVPGLGPLFDQFATLTVLALLALIAAPLLLRLLRKRELSAKNQSAASMAEEIFRGRYARGDLDRNQFILMLRDLRTQNPRKT
jgi:uncharacterized membrane protein